MTTNQTPVQRCQYCGSDDLGLGWQHGEALVTTKSMDSWAAGFGIYLPPLGAVVYQWAAEPISSHPIK